MKTCTKCKTKKPYTSFYPAKQNRDGKHSWCRDCCRTAAIKNHRKNVEDPGYRKVERVRRLFHKFRITQEEYDAILKAQKGKCAICKRPPHDYRKGVLLPLSVDHDHKTGKVRGLLCKRCNTAIGLLDDNLTLVKRAVVYLSGKNFR